MSGDVMVAVVAAIWPLPSVAVAVTLQEPGAKGAVYRPVLAPMLPQEAAQVAATFEVNCCVAPSLKVGVSGAIVNVGAGPTVSTALAVYAVPLAAVAPILQTLPWATDAVNKPLAVMLPQEAVQSTGRFAVNC